MQVCLYSCRAGCGRELELQLYTCASRVELEGSWARQGLELQLYTCASRVELEGTWARQGLEGQGKGQPGLRSCPCVPLGGVCHC